MTNETLGLQVEQMNTLARQFAIASERFNAAQQHIDLVVKVAWWAGPQADRFRQSWQTHLGPHLRQASAALVEQQHVLTRQVREQIAASAAESSVGTSIASIAGGDAGGSVDGSVSAAVTDSLINAYGWLSNAKSLQEAIPLISFMTKFGLSHGEGVLDSLNAGLGMSKSAASGLSGWSVVGLAVSGYDIWRNGSTYGWTSGQVYAAEVSAVGSVIATAVAGPVGGVVFDVSMKATGWAVNEIDKHFDTSGAFVDSVIARTGKVPDYSGASGLPRYIGDAVLNVFSPKAWGF
jgi:hypothetical protein